MTKKMFGTDGIRDVAGQGYLSCLNVKKIGRTLGIWLERNNVSKDTTYIIIGQDTRESCSWIEYLLRQGLELRGYTVRSCGVLPTPAVAFLSKKFNIALGIMISASHNPWDYNGIKFFSNSGLKLSDNHEIEIEKIFFSLPDEKVECDINNIHMSNFKADNPCIQEYVNFLLSKCPKKLNGKVLLDCANGVASLVAKQIFEGLGMNVETYFSSPNGKNINSGCGSLYPKYLAEKIKETDALVGFAFDGDGDRVIAVDEEGTVRDGDFIMGILAKDMLEKDCLSRKTVVSTHMANLGFELFVKGLGCEIIRVDVGDKNILKIMNEKGYNFGGEQSGHIIFYDELPAGDGFLTAIKLCEVLINTNKPLSELCKNIQIFPQKIFNLKVKNKPSLENNVEIKTFICDQRALLENSGRILLRYSGTEPLLRIMIEAKDTELVERIGKNIYEKMDTFINK